MEGNLEPFASAYTSTMTHLSRFDDLHGLPCNTAHFNDFTRRNRYDHNYPSPPPTQSKCSVPLPTLENTCADFSADEDSRDCHDASMYCRWCSNASAPISPPPTLPTPSQELPPSNDEDREFFPVASHSDLKVSTSFSRPTNDLDMQSDLLSPLSPDWNPGHIADMRSVSPDESVLLRELPLDVDDDFSMREAVVEKKKHVNSSSKNGGLWTPRTSPVDLKVYHSLSSPSPQTALPVYSELPVDQAPPYPVSPFMQLHYLPPIDDVFLRSPATPSRRSCKTLPEPEFFVHPDFDESDMDTLMCPPSPSSPTLALPGADFEDDDFSFGPSSNFGSAYYSTMSDPLSKTYSPFTSSSSPRSNSLLLDDPDVPTPRSPSPDNYDLDSSLLNLPECSDPDIQNLIELRRRSMEAEQAAKSLERTMLDEGWIYKSNEAHRTRKRAKERCKELSAMLRLRLGEKDVAMPSIDDEDVRSVKKRDGVTPTPVKKEKEVSIVRDMKQLVARMLLKRKELETVKTGGRCTEPKTVMHSPLRSSWVYGLDESDDEVHEGSERVKDAEMEDLDDDIEMETGLNLSAFSEPSSTNGVEYRDPPWTF